MGQVFLLDEDAHFKVEITVFADFFKIALCKLFYHIIQSSNSFFICLLLVFAHDNPAAKYYRGKQDIEQKADILKNLYIERSRNNILLHQKVECIITCCQESGYSRKNYVNYISNNSHKNTSVVLYH